MLVGCGMWAYVLGAVTAKVAALDADTARFREDMDALRSFCRVKRLPTEMRLRLKEYFRHRRALLKDVANNRLIEELSPGLRGEVGRSESGATRRTAMRARTTTPLVRPIWGICTK